MARELSLTYGGVTVGGTSGREITGFILNTKKFEEAVCEVVFDIYKTTEASFSSEITTIENAFSKPFQDLVVTQGSTDIYTYKQSTNTGLDAKPEIVKKEDNATGRSRRYTVRITVGLPASTGAELVTGLREHTVEVAYSPSRIRTVTVMGVFTASGTSNARTQYEAQISSLETSVFSALSITAANRELVEEPQADHSYNTKTVTFRRVWRELIFPQGGTSNDDSALVRQVLQISRRSEAPGDSPNVKRLVTLDVNYDAWVDKTVSTDLRGKYNAIRGWIITQVGSTLSGGTVALIDERPSYNYDDNRISATMVCMGTAGGSFLERSVDIEDELNPGWVLVPAWTGNPLSKYDYQGPAARRRTVTDTKKLIGFQYSLPSELLDGGQGIISGAGISVVTEPGGLKKRHISSKPKHTHKRLGKDGYTIDVTEIVKVDVFEYFAEIQV